MTDIGQARQAVIKRTLEDGRTASSSQRRAAFENARLAESLRALVGTIVTQALTIADRNIAAARGSGLADRFRNARLAPAAS